MTEQHMQQIAELAARVERHLLVAGVCARAGNEWLADANASDAARYSAEAFRIAQEGRQ